MPNAIVFVINGVEDIEAVTTIDILRRGNVRVDVVSVEDSLEVTCAQKTVIKADKLLKDSMPESYDVVVIPGGTLDWLDNDDFMAAIGEIGKKGKQRIAAICIAPVVLGKLGLLKGKKATSHPAGDRDLEGAEFVRDSVVTDGLITTSRGPATAPLFALEILTLLVGKEASETVKTNLLLKSLESF
ncbi:MAG: DJ-1/PfpI family protein [Deltaproteobacteria bacterium]|nr:DJ-1/PfpI family protein [Deltaproteobacteria bacterium]